MPARRYVEENGSAAMLATKMSAGVAPEVNLRERVYMLLPSVNKAAHSGCDTHRRCHQKSRTGASVAPQKDLCIPKKSYKKLKKKQFTNCCEEIFFCISGSSSGLSLILNVEQYEYMRGPQNDAGVKVNNIFVICTR